MQRIEVKNFGPLKDITLDIKDYMVFIGPQASGKSTLAKLIYFFWKVESIYRKEIIANYAISKILNPSIERTESIEKLKDKIRDLFFDFFPKHRNGEIKFAYLDEATILLNVVSLSDKYHYDDVTIDPIFFTEFDEIDSKIIDPTNLGLFLGNQQFNINTLSNEQKTILSQGLLQNLLSTLAKSDSEEIFIPAGRSILSLLSNSFVFIENKNLDYFNEDFIRLTNTIRKFLGTSEYRNNFGKIARMQSEGDESDVFSITNDLSFRILRGDFFVDGKEDGIMHYSNGSGFVVPLKHTSSGQQESTWLISTIQYLLVNSSENEYDIVIEEPEVNLFPNSIRDITNLITLLANNGPHQTRVIVTTHSPYVLATLNNSIKAFYVSQIESKANEVNAILSKKFWINPDNIFVGFMNKNEGEDNFNIKDIFDSELGLIKHEVLDQVSDDIMKQFDELLDIQYSE